MTKSVFKSVDEYLAGQPEALRDVLERVRMVIRKAVPQAEEVISYKMLAYKLKDEPVLYLAGWKQHFSLYPATATMVAEFKDEIAPYFDHKSTLRFPLSQPVPVNLIDRLAKFRATEVSGRKAKTATSKTR